MDDTLEKHRRVQKVTVRRKGSRDELHKYSSLSEGNCTDSANLALSTYTREGELLPSS